MNCLICHAPVPDADNISFAGVPFAGVCPRCAEIAGQALAGGTDALGRLQRIWKDRASVTEADATAVLQDAAALVRFGRVALKALKGGQEEEKKP